MKTCCVLLALLLVLGLGSCRREAASGPAEDRAASDRIKVKSLSGEALVEIHLDAASGARQVEMSSGPVLHGRHAEGGKIKYRAAGGFDVAEVKASDDGFKLRSPDGKLMWKVKLGPDKVKISDNEAGARPFVLKAREGDHVMVLREEAVLGKVRCSRAGEVDTLVVEDERGTDLWKSQAARCTTSIGLMLLREMPEPDRSILIAELWARGR